MPRKYHREVRELSNCPNCNEKLSPFYFKQNCPHCGANLMYYDFENRLQQDADKVAREAENFAKNMQGIKSSAIGSVEAIIRLVSFILPILALLLPTFNVDGEGISTVTMMRVIFEDPGSGIWNTALVLWIVDFAVVIICSLVALVASLFSFTKNGLKRNVIISALGIIIFAGLYIAIITTNSTAGSSVNISYGFFIIILLQIITMALHFTVNNKLKNS